jgi:hypothetical protein
MKPLKAPTVNLSGRSSSARQTAWEIVQEAAKTDQLLATALNRRCDRGFDCERGPFDPPRRCQACCGRSLR